MIKEDGLNETDFKAYKKDMGSLDLQWVLMLFGTAVGAGIIFLPINAGLYGVIPLIAITCFVFPLAFLPHLGINRFCLTSKKADNDITETAVEHFGQIKGNFITIAYFASIFPTLLLYGIALTNTLQSLLEDQLGFAHYENRALLSFLVSALMVGVMITSEKMVLKVSSIVVYPLILTLFGTSLYLIPQWSLEHFNLANIDFNFKHFCHAILVIIPTIVFSFNYMPAVSAFSSAYKLKLDKNAGPHTAKILAKTTLLMTLFTMFFVFSCVLSLSAVEIEQAKIANIPVLSIFAKKAHGNLVFAWIAQIISIAAICSSFFGHYLGASEGCRSIIQKVTRDKIKSHSKLSYNFAALILFLSVWWAAYYDFSVLDMIRVIVSPILAAILYIFPVIAVYRLREMKKYKSPWDIFTVGVGVLTIIGFIVEHIYR